ncbi:MAG: [FeFe] hydrogenase H-cluster radical SAM maturase HydE, partial [Defluviitaleaceae bacterium]|nr:[FeFe] hydrogenase H-cluster radical SAM maturase HydE [Defluviitaleaceae bacterium]
MNQLVDKLAKERTLPREEFKLLLSCQDADAAYLHQQAREASRQVYGNQIFLRGLIEFTNHCKHNCYYCGIRQGNGEVPRYRLSQADILECCRTGYALGFRTFVLQGGEDDYFTDDILTDIIRDIRQNYPDCAITLSIGERSRDSYQRLFDAGVNRYLLRHETANTSHYNTLHPPHMSLVNRKKCLQDLKEIGFQVGCGFMVGSPGQILDHVVDDLLFIKELDPAMVGIGPFIPHGATKFANEPTGSLALTLNALAILRVMNPVLLLPATTALGTIDKKGRELGVLAGANVVMPNLSPLSTRKKYLLYDNKICLEDDPAHCRGCLDG